MQTHSSTSPNEIPYGFCFCGCGEKTKLAPYTLTRIGWCKGQPTRFINGHNARIQPRRPPPTDRTIAIERFWTKVDKNGPVPAHRPELGPCWTWTGYIGKNGYGQLSKGKGILESAHRLAYEFEIGPIPEGLLVCHHCDNRACCRLSHLFLGTRTDNHRDMWAKGRGRCQPPKGSASPRAKLTEDQVREIRKAYSYHKVTLQQLAERYGVSPSPIHLIVTRKTWKHVE